ncbi:MAG: TonB system transport protein ExbD [Xanthobacteraceae bacterium]|jgi:biopolymer transport protein ExbD|nr:TonB system transport protein ExbD [Xanthobacteraceae bacterium]
MAANLDSGEDLAEMSEINVTPFIDVMLVLLIIFMVAAPLSTVDAPVDLPVSVAKPQPRPDKPVFVTLKADLALLVGEKQVSIQEFPSALGVATKLHRDERIFLRADQAVPYRELTRIMNALRVEGYFKIALVGLEGDDKRPTLPAAPAPAPEAKP